MSSTKTSRHRAAALAAVLCLAASMPILGHQDHDHAGKEQAADAQPDDGAYRRGGSRWGRNYFPNVPLVTHEGETVRFFDDLIKDKVVAINLIYTSCEDSCPLITARLAKVQQILGDRVGRDIFMYTLSIDPAHDTPEVLRAHMEKYRVGPGWVFLTGKEQDILLLRRKLGFLFQGIRTDLKDHNGAVLIGNQSTGQWMKRSPMDSPYFLAAQIGTWLTNWKVRDPHANENYASAPTLQVPSMGENLFRTRCAVCHTIGGAVRTVGGGDAIEASQHRAGPDLLGVTQRREREWLARWLADPARMIEGKDPIATALYAQYDNVVMPNFRLSEVEIDALIEFLGAESRRIRAGEASGRTAPASAK